MKERAEKMMVDQWMEYFREIFIMQTINWVGSFSWMNEYVESMAMFEDFINR